MRTNDTTGKHIGMLIVAGSAIGIIAALLIPGEINLAYAIVFAAAVGILVGSVIDRFDRRRDPPDAER